MTLRRLQFGPLGGRIAAWLRDRRAGAVSGKLRSLRLCLCNRIARWRGKTAADYPALCAPETEVTAARLEAEGFDRDRLESYAASLAALGRQLEAAFLPAGRTIEELSESGFTLLEETETLLRLALGQESGYQVFATAAEMLRSPLELNEQSLDTTSRLVASLEDVERRMGAVLRMDEALERTRALSGIVMMLKIECAKLPPNVRSLFLGLTAEIQELRARMMDTLAGELERVKTRREVVEGVRARLSRLERQQRDSAHRARQIETVLAQLNQRLVENRDRDVALVGVSRDVAAQVQDLVKALQHQDILAQRLEHVRQGILQLAGGVDALGSENPAALAELARIESAQLAGFIRTLGETRRSIVGSLTRLSASVDQLEREGVLLRDLDGSTAASDGVVQVLLDSFSEIDRLLNNLVDDVGRAHEELRPVGAQASDLSEAIAVISFEMRLIALNTQIRAAQDGGSTGLKVLSASVCEIADATAAMASATATELHAVVEGLRSTLETMSAFSRQCTTARESFAAGAGTHELELHRFRDRSLKLLYEVTNRAARMREAAVSTQQAIAEPLPGEAGAAEIGQRLAALAEAIGESLPQQAGEAPAITVESRRYTMESQRDIHRAVCNSPSPARGQNTPQDAPEAVPATPAGSGGGGNGGGDIEFF